MLTAVQDAKDEQKDRSPPKIVEATPSKMAMSEKRSLFEGGNRSESSKPVLEKDISRSKSCEDKSTAVEPSTESQSATEANARPRSNSDDKNKADSSSIETQSMGSLKDRLALLQRGNADKNNPETSKKDPQSTSSTKAENENSLKDRLALLQSGTKHQNDSEPKSTKEASPSKDSLSKSSPESHKDVNKILQKFGEHASSEASKSGEVKQSMEKPASNSSGLKDRIRALNESGQNVQKTNDSGAEKVQGSQSSSDAAQREVQSSSSPSISKEVPPFADRLATFANQATSEPAETTERKKSPPANNHTKSIRKELVFQQSDTKDTSKPREPTQKPVLTTKPASGEDRGMDESAKESPGPHGQQETSPQAAPLPSLSLKERMARLQAGQDSNIRDVAQEEAKNQPFRKSSSMPVGHWQGQEASTSKKSPQDDQLRKDQKPPSFRFSHLSQQAREVAEALGSDATEEEEEEEEPEAEATADGNIRNQTVFNRVSMFETGDMAAGWDLEKPARQEPGRIGGVPAKETKIDTASLDVGDIKNRWKQGNVAKDEKKTNSASEEALFRCYAAAATRTGGVFEIQQKMECLAAGKPVPKNTPPKQSSKIAEIAESIHFDPNTMMPGAQHPSLNYNVVESTSRANEWRKYTESNLASLNMDDDDELPPPPPPSWASKSSESSATEGTKSPGKKARASAKWLLEKRGLS